MKERHFSSIYKHPFKLNPYKQAWFFSPPSLPQSCFTTSYNPGTCRGIPTVIHLDSILGNINKKNLKIKDTFFSKMIILFHQQQALEIHTCMQ